MITVVAYDSAWAERFDELHREYSDALASAAVPVVVIEHVGSTSVRGLASKPVIDCDIVVTQTEVSRASDVLVDLGFSPLGELGIPQRWAFKEPDRLAGTNTYVIVTGSLALRNHRAVRDTLRARPDLRDRYGSLKKRIGLTAGSFEEYGQKKNALVQEILATAGLTDAERASIDSNQVPTRDEVPRSLHITHTPPFVQDEGLVRPRAPEKSRSSSSGPDVPHFWSSVWPPTSEGVGGVDGGGDV